MWTRKAVGIAWMVAVLGLSAQAWAQTPEPEEASEETGSGQPGEQMKLPETEYMESGEEEMPPEEPAAVAEETPAKETEGAEEESGEEAAGEEEKKGVTILKKGETLPEEYHEYTIQGATLLHPEDTAISLTLGFPDVKGMYHLPWTDSLELAVGLGFFYGLNPRSLGDITGGSFLAMLRWRICSEDGHTLSLFAEPAIHALVDPVGGMGLVAGLPGLLWDYRILKEWHVSAGVLVPWGGFFTFSDGASSLRVPILGRLGMEFAVSEDFHVFGQMEFGADIWSGDYFQDTYFQARGYLGASFLL